MRILISILVLMMLALSSQASDRWISELGSGNGFGTDISNCESAANHTSSSPGNVNHLVGTFWVPFTPPSSGTPTLPITYYFEPGCNFTTNCWPSTGAWALMGRTNIIMDGGMNGIIQNTANGSGLLFSNDSVAILGNINNGGNVDGLSVLNLTVTNIYNRIAGSTDQQNGSDGIAISGNSITISNNNLSDANGVLVYSGPQPGDPTEGNFKVINNRIFNWNHGITIGLGTDQSTNSNCLLTNTVITGNFFDHADKWDGDHNLFHMDGIIIQNNTVDPTVVYNGMYIYKNTWGPNFLSYATSDHGATCPISQFLDGQVQQMQNEVIYENIFQTYDTNAWADGFLGASGTNIWVINNTVEMIGTNIISRGAQMSVGGTNAFCYNNLFTCSGGIALNGFYGRTNFISGGVTNSNPSLDKNGTTILYMLTNFLTRVWSDYNIFVPDTNGSAIFGVELDQTLAGGTVLTSGNLDSLSKWQTYIGNLYGNGGAQDCGCGWGDPPIWNTTHADPHSKTNAVTFLSGTFIPATNDTTTIGGTNMFAIIAYYGLPNSDFNGSLRPSTGGWTIGAYQADTIFAPIILKITYPAYNIRILNSN